MSCAAHPVLWRLLPPVRLVVSGERLPPVSVLICCLEVLMHLLSSCLACTVP